MDLASKHPWLFKRGETYYLRAKVPADIRHSFGKAEIKKSLKTGDRRTAEGLIHIEAAKVQALFDATRSARSSNGLSSSELRRIADDWLRTEVQRLFDSDFLSLSQQQREEKAHDAELDEADLLSSDGGVPWAQRLAQRLMETEGISPDWKDETAHRLTELLLRNGVKLARARRDAFRGNLASSHATTLPEIPSLPSPPSSPLPLGPLLDKWEAVLAGKMKTRQVDTYLSDLRALSVRIPTVEQLRTKNLQEHLELDLHGASANTVVRKFSAYKKFWRYLVSHEIVSIDADPFPRVNTPAKRDSLKREAWTPEQVCELWREAHCRKLTALANVIRISAFTGGRVEAICSLRRRSIRIDRGIMTIHFSDKTDAGHRDVPVHRCLRPLIDDLLADASQPDDFLIAVTATNKHGERSTGIGKQFGRMKKNLGYGRELVFHSLRHTVATMLDQAEQPTGIMEAILGHKHTGETRSRYSKGSLPEARLKWLTKALRYPDRDFMTSTIRT